MRPYLRIQGFAARASSGEFMRPEERGLRKAGQLGCQAEIASCLPPWRLDASEYGMC